MKKLWTYIAAIFAGIIGGMVLMFQMTKKSISNTTIKGKVKQKRNTNSTIDITNTIKKESKRTERDKKREERRNKRKLKKAARKQ